MESLRQGSSLIADRTKVSRGAQELAYRRWRPSKSVAEPSAIGCGAQTSAIHPARLLAHHRWGTEPKPYLGVSPPVGAVEPHGAGSDNSDLALLIGLGIIAALIYAGRKEREPNASPFGLPHQTADSRPGEDSQLWLAGGSAAVTVLLLIFSSSARRSWGLVVGLECVVLATLLPVTAGMG